MARGVIDWVGRWYHVARERGRNDFVDFGRVDTSTDEHEWFDYSHGDGDGVHGMVICARNLGRKDPSIPRAKESKPPKFFAKLGILKKGLSGPRPPKMQWKNKDLSASVKPKDFEWKVFSHKETVAIHERAKAAKVSVNALMMAELNAVVLPALLEGEASGRWLFPVNMRGPVWKGVGAHEGLGNQSSGIPLHAHPKMSASEIHGQIRAGLAGGQHWFTWWMLHVGKLVGMRGVRHFSKQSEKKSFFLGSFTNMGFWDAPEASEHEAWLIAPPGSHNYPIGVGIVAWNGRMSIVLKIHASVCQDREMPKKIFADFVQRLLAQS